jgi:hypothetical protein
MLAKNPADRPTAKQVSEVLADTLEVPEEYYKGSDINPFETELWEAHKLIAEVLSIDELKKKGIKSFKRINEGGGSTSLKYRIKIKGGKEITLTISELCDKGYATYKSAEIEEPWEEHMIELESADVIAKKGYAKIKRVQISYRKRYLITTVSGREIDKGYEWLISEGLAHLKLSDIDSDAPWPEHGTRYVIENMTRLGVKSIYRMEVGGEHRYKIVYNEIIDGKNKVNEKVSINNLKLMGFVK